MLLPATESTEKLINSTTEINSNTKSIVILQSVII